MITGKLTYRAGNVLLALLLSAGFTMAVREVPEGGGIYLLCEGCTGSIYKAFYESRELGELASAPRKRYIAAGEEVPFCAYEELADGTWLIGDRHFRYRKRLFGETGRPLRLTEYTVLTDDPEMSFERVWKSIISSYSGDWPDDTAVVPAAFGESRTYIAGALYGNEMFAPPVEGLDWNISWEDAVRILGDRIVSTSESARGIAAKGEYLDIPAEFGLQFDPAPLCAGLCNVSVQVREEDYPGLLERMNVLFGTEGLDAWETEAGLVPDWFADRMMVLRTYPTVQGFPLLPFDACTQEEMIRTTPLVKITCMRGTPSINDDRRIIYFNASPAAYADCLWNAESYGRLLELYEESYGPVDYAGLTPGAGNVREYAPCDVDEGTDHRGLPAMEEECQPRQRGASAHKGIHNNIPLCHH